MSPRTNWKKTSAIVGWLVPALLMACNLFSLRGEEQASLFQYQLQVRSEDFAAPFGQPASLLLSVASEPNGFHLTERFNSRETPPRQNLLSETFERADREREPSVMFLRLRMPSRYSYSSWAGFKTGYGELFRHDYLGRSRTNGAGIQEQDWFYLKVSVKF